MRLAGSRCRFSPVAAVVLAVALGVFASSVVFLAGFASAADAAAAPLTVSVDHPLSLLDEEVNVTIGGQISGSLNGCRLVVRVKGPAESSQVGQSTPEVPEANKIVVLLGANTTATTPASATTTTTETANTGTAADLAAGKLNAEVTVPAGMPARPGAYLLVVEVKLASGTVVARGQAWVGKAAPRDTPLDLAFVWPVSLGIHRDADDVFYDQVLEKAIAPAADGAGDLRGLLGLSGRFSDWDFTLALEPVLLTQLRDMAGGYDRLDASGNKVAVTEDDPAAQDAGEVLTALKGLGTDESVEIAVGPYSGADLGILGTQGWRDGFEQIQMGKQEVQQTLALGAPPKGGYSPLGLTTESLGYYAEASVDHVVVDAALAGFLTEPIETGTIAVRARDIENGRVTLIFASSGMSAHMAAPWDAGVFAAALAAELATGGRDAMVLTPRVEFALVPEAYLESIGEMLESAQWVRTQTLTGLLRAHAPDTRPILLKTEAGMPQGYIEESLLTDVRAAHEVVTDLAEIADATRAPVEKAHALLYFAESSWWSRLQTSPREASIGLKYVEKARVLAQGELDKVRLLGIGSTLIVGNEGVLGLALQNDANYPVSVDLRLEGDGVTVTDGEVLEIELAPGRTEIPVGVRNAEGSHTLDVTLLAGTSPLDTASHSLRFLTIMTVLPWMVAVVLVLGLGVFLLVRRRLRKRHPAQAA
jgi:hypothetical protein